MRTAGFSRTSRGRSPAGGGSQSAMCSQSQSFAWSATASGRKERPVAFTAGACSSWVSNFIPLVALGGGCRREGLAAEPGEVHPALAARDEHAMGPQEVSAEDHVLA